MLASRRLDDQPYEEIVAEAEGRLPWLCPVWTDHNAHDPGITLLELMAWYKEMQQFQMDQLTPAIQRKLLELAGLTLLPPRGALCPVELPPEAPARPVLSRLETAQGVLLELAEPVPARRPALVRMAVERDGGAVDLTERLAGGPPFSPFAFGGEGESRLLLGFSQKPEGPLRLWFQVEPPVGPQRNPATDGMAPPRALSWELTGLGPVEPLADETWALSWSGYVTLPAGDGWQPGEEGLYWLRLGQTDGGCEEQVRLAGLSAGRFRAVQQETRAACHRFTVAAAAHQTVTLATAQARHGELAVFLREPAGWRQLEDYQARRHGGGLDLTVDAAGAAEDGAENLLAVSLHPLRARELLLDAQGRPGETFRLHLDGQTALPERLCLLCQTLQEDGTVRPALWRCVDDLASYGPRDRVFTYDARRETVTVGDGRHGAVVAPGPGAVLVAELVLSHCGEGNLPADAPLVFSDDGAAVRHGAAWGGRGAETLEEGRARLLSRLNRTEKCLSAEDYAQRARETPGLRVAAAKALPGYDSAAPHRRRDALVSVVVLPAGEGRRPAANEWFLRAVDRQLRRCRPICIQTRAIPARYVEFALSARLVTAPGAAPEALRAALAEAFAPGEARIGAPVRQDDAAALLQRQPGVFQVERLELRGLGPGVYRTAAGDLEVPPDAIASLELAELELIRP